MDNLTDQLTFQIAKKEMQALFGQLQIRPNLLSPCSNYLNGVQPVQTVSNELAAAANQPAFRQMAATAATPDLLINIRIGGGSVDLQEMKLCRRRDLGDSLVLMVEAENDQLVLRRYADLPEFLDWLLSRYAGRSEQTTANYIPPTVETGEFLYILHAIDAYRIATFKGMLNYTAGQLPTIGLREFTEAMRQSVRSKDIRWLLPAFLILTPGLNAQAIDLSAEKTAALMERGFLAAIKAPTAQEMMLTFGEAGRSMGVEFYRTWLLGIGMETLVAAPAGIRAVNRLFLAPTALANHLALIDTAPGQPARVNHQAMTFDQLAVKLKQVMAQAASLETAPPASLAAQPVQPAAAPAGGPRFCRQCGTPADPGVKFCSKCGARL